MSAEQPLIATWREFKSRDGLNVLEEDKRVLDSYKKRNLYHTHATYEEYIRDTDFDPSSDNRLHLGLIPIPYLGNLAKARIFILMLNPGFLPIDYYAETHCREFREAMERNLRQEFQPDDYPMISLNPRFAWLGGAEYWTRKLSGVLSDLRRQRGLTWTEALQIASREIAVVELCPYHSQNFKLPDPMLSKLKSVKLMKDFVNEVLVPKAKKGDACIIATRSVSHWELPNNVDNIVIYSGAASRAAHLTLNSEGGKIIANFLNRH